MSGNDRYPLLRKKWKMVEKVECISMKNLLRTNDPSSVQRVLLLIFKSPPPINPLGFEKIIAYKTAEA